MKIFVIGSDVPYPTSVHERVTAINVQLYEVLLELRRVGHAVTLQIIGNEAGSLAQLTTADAQQLDRVRSMGIEVLPPLHANRSDGTFQTMASMIRILSGVSSIADFYPTYHLREILRTRIHDSGAEVIFTMVSPEGVAATFGVRDCPTLAFQGDIDFHPLEVRYRDAALFEPSANGVPSLKSRGLGWYRARKLEGFRRAHLRLMRDVEGIANATALNAEFYRAQGHAHSFYIGTTWNDYGSAYATGVIAQARQRLALGQRPLKIIGHVGHLARTGNTYGLRFLLVELLPRLAQTLEGLEYEVHLIGGGTPVPSLRRYLDQPRLVLRGHVPDLEAELQTSDLLLLLNNVGPLIEGYSRHLLAWSMGLCLLVHANSRQAIPEICHLENTLVGSTPEEIAQLVRLALTDVELHWRIRTGGRALYERRFAPSVFTQSLFGQEARQMVACAEHV